ncbi:hypothetical protein C8034_v005220 [Colletotrichum sidae]|uniref:Beta-xylosidase n=3 Tax=Colletotrichum orbiculare species complex TaxID=2707354 RepID=A0A4V3HXS2_COLTR|nr:hypothetical protein C8035_v000197 [Colletotrichum spinosum]TDZ73207.1 hypothetical protein CTRI78_v001381 [Colletotrichum trifolii]TEA22767.1 hypothetical protein C8034_v005220 [Colletotrichum sidae]
MATRHHHTTNGGIATRRASRNAAFQEKIRQMRLPLAPLVQISTGAVHPSFPATLLNFWLLTEAQLDDLARFYHQRSPSPWSGQYPCPIQWRSGLTLEEKRRKIGKFIGLRGCDSPIRIRIKTEEQIVEEARLARLAEDEEALRRKMPWYL